MLLHSPCDSICLALPVCVFLQVATSTPWVWPATTTLTRCSASRQQRSSTVAWRWWPSWVSSTSWGVIQGFSRVISALWLQQLLYRRCYVPCCGPGLLCHTELLLQPVGVYPNTSKLHSCSSLPSLLIRVAGQGVLHAGRKLAFTECIITDYFCMPLLLVLPCPAGYGVQALSTGEGALGSLARFGESF